MKPVLDFIVIGAQKCGTTSLFEYLRRHPQLALPAGKEVPFFSHDRLYRGSWAEYLHKAFAFADAECRWGTVTPHYMVGGLYEAATDSAAERGDPRTVPARIHRRLPDVRLIAIVRDPVERARSHHAMARMNGWDERGFAAAVDALLQPEALADARAHPQEHTGYVTWGEYGRILQGYYDTFPREQLLVLHTEELRSSPRAVLGSVFRFLGVDEAYVPENLGTTYRTGASARRMRRLDLNAVQAAAARTGAARRLWHALPEPTRRRIDQRFDRVNYWVDLWNRRGDDTAEAHDDEVLAALRAHYEADGRRLASLSGVTPPWLASAPSG